MKNKIVYILGAGFSVEANAPTQEKLIKSIFDTWERHRDAFEDEPIENFRSFLTEALRIDEDNFSNVPLEDVFTPIDRCLIDNISFRNYDLERARKLKDHVSYLIGKTLQVLLRESEGKKDYIDLFAEHITKLSSTRCRYQYPYVDPVSVISLNWDILLDNSIKTTLDTQYSNCGVVDYCCHISSYNKEDSTVKPGLEQLGRGGFNVKLLKLHGSLNWVQCPRCLRLYVDFYNKISVECYKNSKYCRHCCDNFGHHNSQRLISNLVMPTFLKDLTNPQYKIIWQNAGIELSEANHIVFIGYSLPYADFEMRQLLSRMTRENACITVVSYSNDPKVDMEAAMLKKRYRSFFGNRQIAFEFNGAKSYINNLQLPKV